MPEQEASKLNDLQLLQFVYDLTRRAPVDAQTHDAAKGAAVELAKRLQDLEAKVTSLQKALTEYEDRVAFLQKAVLETKADNVVPFPKS